MFLQTVRPVQHADCSDTLAGGGAPAGFSHAVRRRGRSDLAGRYTRSRDVVVDGNCFPEKNFITRDEPASVRDWSRLAPGHGLGLSGKARISVIPQVNLVFLRACPSTGQHHCSGHPPGPARSRPRFRERVALFSASWGSFSVPSIVFWCVEWRVTEMVVPGGIHGAGRCPWHSCTGLPAGSCLANVWWVVLITN